MVWVHGWPPAWPRSVIAVTSSRAGARTTSSMSSPAATCRLRRSGIASVLAPSTVAVSPVMRVV